MAVAGSHGYLVVPKGVALFPLSSNTSIADTDVPESLSLQLPVVSPRGEALGSQDLWPVVETLGVGSTRQAGFDPLH